MESYKNSIVDMKYKSSVTLLMLTRSLLKVVFFFLLIETLVFMDVYI